MVVVWESSLAGWDFDDGHAELLSAEGSGDVPAFGAVFGSKSRQGSVVCSGDVEDRRIWCCHCIELWNCRRQETE